ncbi:hypothetical protein B0T17DRAFT_656409 [Bombardia bombarda]|uniref:t-SNARE coiled-coil homology domain-containing protein n=1 Tax=Bombardia bombarda TaxID=252184 RepID=A0AA40BY83_9PEZI|nr:hypothetical protein B0T17DRAFT_656409 [Bombardia bombarda]
MGLFFKMRKFFGKKSSKEEADQSGQSTPVGRASPNQNSNPYAQQPPAADPYANRQQPQPSNAYPPPNRTGLPSGPRPGGGLPGRPAPPHAAQAQASPPPPPYNPSPQPGSGYANDRFGASGGYGGNKYSDSGALFDNKQSGAGPSSSGYNAAPRRPGGYGGLGAQDNQSRDSNPSPFQPAAASAPPRGDGYSRPGASGAGGDSYGGGGGGGGGYGEQEEMTEEERELAKQKEDIQAGLNATVDTSSSINQHLFRIRDMGLSARENLYNQNESLIRTEKNLDKAAVYNRHGSNMTRDLERANGSMFRPQWSKSRLNEFDQQALAAEAVEKQEKAETQRLAYAEKTQLLGGGKSARKKYEFHDDADSDAKFTFEDESGDMSRANQQVNANLRVAAEAMADIQDIAHDISKLVDNQDRIQRITEKTELADDHIRKNKLKLDRIR